MPVDATEHLANVRCTRHPSVARRDSWVSGASTEHARTRYRSEAANPIRNDRSCGPGCRWAAPHISSVWAHASRRTLKGPQLLDACGTACWRERPSDFRLRRTDRSSRAISNVHKPRSGLSVLFCGIKTMVWSSDSSPNNPSLSARQWTTHADRQCQQHGGQAAH